MDNAEAVIGTCPPMDFDDCISRTIAVENLGCLNFERFGIEKLTGPGLGGSRGAATDRESAIPKASMSKITLDTSAKIFMRFNG